MQAYEIITNRIMEKLEQGVVPWQRPWRITKPKNLISGKEYRGINILMLGLENYSCSHWATFKQIRKLGGSVNKGTKGTPIVFWNWVPRKNRKASSTSEDSQQENDGELNERMVPLLRCYRVFNLKQTSGIEIPVEEKGANIKPIDTCESITNQMPDPPLVTLDGGNRAFYRSLTDSVHLPMPRSFKSAEEYYSTLFHELVHSTGHPKRLNRSGIEEPSRFGSESYSKEELIAEIGSAFLCGQTGIEKQTIDNSTSYISGWLKALKDDKKLVIIAAALAQKASDYICDVCSDST